uniref:Uncharacterized protein n=1 Tax=CrAss-like virus sp. ctt4r3 TaxID=2823619 RepID=A0A8S5L7D8_9CAUD|nr:MAG TPA: hypothetical protein [CrAss-like virus sp. ctt4r3]
MCYTYRWCKYVRQVGVQPTPLPGVRVESND